jgi:hypothetical protein
MMIKEVTERMIEDKQPITPIPALYVQLNRIEGAFFWISLAALVTSFVLAQFSSHYDALAFGGLGLFFLWIATKIMLDVWYWWITRYLPMSRFEMVRRLRWAILYLGATLFAAALIMSKTDPPDWLVVPSLVLIGIGFMLQFIVFFWSKFGTP